MQDEPISNLVELWISARSYAPTSARQRRSILRNFTLAVGDISPALITPTAVIAWWAQTESLSPASRRAYHVAVSGFISWCRSVGIDAPRVLDEVRRPRVPRSVPKVLTGDQERLLRICAHGTDLELPLLLMLDMGLRRTEAARACAEDVTDGWMTVRGKGGAVDRVPVPPTVARLLPPAGALSPWGHDALAAHVVAAMRSVGIHGHTCHSLRRTFGTRLMAEGASAVDTMRLLRHSSLHTTTFYVASQYDAA